jgi:plasmid stabilization system protein ParE
MNIRWTEKATAYLESIGDHIAEDNPEAALRTVTAIFERIEQLSVFPTVVASDLKKERANWSFLRYRTLLLIASET